jgi:hypothetical protein
MNRFGVALLVIAAALPFVAAQPGHGGQSSCENSHFWFEEKNTCLPEGGPHEHHKPPPEKQCPSDWSWSIKHDCCTPHKPHPPSHPECPKGWGWELSSLCCKSHPSPPKPSGRGGDHGNNGWKRALDMPRSAQQCPMSLNACPISSVNGPTGDFECLDTTNELESCGGCASTGEGQDCTAIKGAWNVACVQGSCAVYTCANGYKRSNDHKSCIPL